MQSARLRPPGWLRPIRDQIATTVTVEPDDFESAPFLGAPKPGAGGSQRGGRGNLSAKALATAEAHQLICDQLTKLLDELNANLAA